MPLDPHSASKEMDYWKRARGRGGDWARAWMYRDKCIQTHTAVCWAPWGGPRGSAFMISIEGERHRLLVNRWKDSCSFPSSLAHPLITSLMIQLIHFLRISHGSLPISSHCLPPPARPIPGDLYWVLDSWSLFSGGLQARLITPRSPINSVQQHPHSLSLQIQPLKIRFTLCLCWFCLCGEFTSGTTRHMWLAAVHKCDCVWTGTCEWHSWNNWPDGRRRSVVRMFLV